MLADADNDRLLSGYVATVVEDICACSHPRDLHGDDNADRHCMGEVGTGSLVYYCACDAFTPPPTAVALRVATALRERTSYIDVGPTDLREWVVEIHAALVEAAHWLAERAAEPVEDDEYGIWNAGMRHAANLLDDGGRDTSA